MAYPEIAAYYGVTLEELGWRDRRVTKSGLRRFLIEVWMHQTMFGGASRFWEDWEIIWTSNTWAYHQALTVWHRRIPKHLSDHDRARVAWLLGRQLRHLNAEMRKTEAKAWRWANQRTI